MNRWYDVLIFGCASLPLGSQLQSSTTELLEGSGVDIDEVNFLTDPVGYKDRWDGRLPAVVACFSQPSVGELEVIEYLSRQRVPVIPIAAVGERFEDFTDQVKHFNSAVIS